MKIMIVDDEKPSRDEMRYVLENSGQAISVIEADCGYEALRKIQEEKPAVVFLDINLPDLTGLQVVELLGKERENITIIFVTAYDQYAIEAFRLRAYHYLLKPFHDEDILTILLAIKREQKTKVMTEGKLALEVDDRIVYVNPKEILYITKKKDDKKVCILTKSGAYECTITLVELEQKLEAYCFQRVHKSILVNTTYIQELHPFFNGAYNVYLQDVKEPIPVSRNYVKKLRGKLEI
ncbi:MAG: LytR/AlgR family response regulator transcription factor [Bacillaceae bacterium]